MNEEILIDETPEPTDRFGCDGERIIMCFDCFEDFAAAPVCPHCGYKMPF